MQGRGSPSPSAIGFFSPSHRRKGLRCATRAGRAWASRSPRPSWSAWTALWTTRASKGRAPRFSSACRFSPSLRGRSLDQLLHHGSEALSMPSQLSGDVGTARRSLARMFFGQALDLASAGADSFEAEGRARASYPMSEPFHLFEGCDLSSRGAAQSRAQSGQVLECTLEKFTAQLVQSALQCRIVACRSRLWGFGPHGQYL